MKNAPIETRFYNKIKINKRTNCWEWLGSLHPRGYGRIWWDGCKKAHRVSWVIHKGKIPKGLNVCHKCDNPPCVNPSHLFVGTQRDNIKDMHNKKRNERLLAMTHASDETHQVSKLTNQDVRFIRDSDLTVVEIEKILKFKVKRLAIIRAKNRETFRDVP